MICVVMPGKCIEDGLNPQVKQNCYVNICQQEDQQDGLVGQTSHGQA